MLVCKSKPHQDRHRYRRGFSSGRNRVHQGWAQGGHAQPCAKGTVHGPRIGVALIVHRPLGGLGGYSGWASPSRCRFVQGRAPYL